MTKPLLSLWKRKKLEKLEAIIRIQATQVTKKNVPSCQTNIYFHSFFSKKKY